MARWKQSILEAQGKVPPLQRPMMTTPNRRGTGIVGSKELTSPVMEESKERQDKKDGASGELQEEDVEPEGLDGEFNVSFDKSA